MRLSVDVLVELGRGWERGRVLLVGLVALVEGCAGGGLLAKRWEVFVGFVGFACCWW